MGLSEYSYKLVIRKVKSLVPDFRYNRKAEDVDCHGYYWADTDRIYLKQPKEYPSKSEFSRVLLHELAHWAMASGKGRVGFKHNFPFKRYSRYSEWAEEIVAERVAERLSYHLGFRYLKAKPNIKNYTKSYRIKLKKEVDRGNLSLMDYKNVLTYINKKTDQVVDYLITYRNN